MNEPLRIDPAKLFDLTEFARQTQVTLDCVAAAMGTDPQTVMSAIERLAMREAPIDTGSLANEHGPNRHERRRDKALERKRR